MGKLIIHDAAHFLKCLEKSREMEKAAMDSRLSSLPDELPEGMSVKEYLRYAMTYLEEAREKVSLLPWIEHRLLPYASQSDHKVYPNRAECPFDHETEREQYDKWWETRWQEADVARNVTVDVFRGSDEDLYFNWTGEHPSTGYQYRIMNGGIIFHDNRWSMHT